MMDARMAAIRARTDENGYPDSLCIFFRHLFSYAVSFSNVSTGAVII